MKNLFVLFIAILIPFSVFGDVLPEPDIFYSDEVDIAENNNIESETTMNEDNINEDIDGIAIDGIKNDNPDTIKINDLEILSSEDDDEDENEEDDANNNSDSEVSLASIGFGFCNEGYDNLSSSLNYAIEIGHPFKVCTLFYNKSTQDIIIEVRIVDTELNADGGLSCSYGSTNVQNFIKKSDLNDIKEIKLPAGEFITKEFEITFPVGLEGDQTYCFSYHIPSLENSDAMISTVINKYSFMKFFVGGINDLKNEIEIKNIDSFLDKNKDLNIKFLLANIGNLEDKIEINGTISNIFGFKKSFQLYGNGIQLIAGGETAVSAALGSIPSYGGWYKIEFTATATPFFSYDISNSSIEPSLLEAKEFTASTTFFQMPWLILIILIILILLIVTIFRKPKEKVVYVQAPQQPTPNTGYQQPQYQQTQYQQPVQTQQPQVAQPQPQYQQPQVAQPQYQQPAQPTENQNNYGQQPTQPTPNQYTPNA